MDKQTQALKLALEALERYQVKRQDFDRFADEITAIREALAEQPAQQQCPPTTKAEMELLNSALPMPEAPEEAFLAGIRLAKKLAAQHQEPTKAMIDAAERIDWSDSDVRGNIVNMWQAMCAAAPQPAQQQGIEQPYRCDDPECVVCCPQPAQQQEQYWEEQPDGSMIPVDPYEMQPISAALSLNSRAQFLIANIKESIEFLDANGAYATLEMLRLQCIKPLTDIACGPYPQPAQQQEGDK